MSELSIAYGIRRRNKGRLISSEKTPEVEPKSSLMKPEMIARGILSKRAPTEDLSDEAFLKDVEPEEDLLALEPEEKPTREYAIRKILEGLRRK